MSNDLGMSPDQVRGHAATINSQLATIESIASQVNQARQASRNPQSFGIEAGEKIIDPASQGSVQTAYNELIAAINAANGLVAGLYNQANDQVSASGGSDHVNAPGVPDGGSHNPYESEYGGSGGGGYAGGGGGGGGGGARPDDEDPTFEGEVHIGPVVSVDTSGSTDYTIDEDGIEIGSKIENEYRFGVGAGGSYEYTDGDYSESGSIDAFTGLVVNNGVSTTVTEDGVTTTAEASVGVVAEVSAEGEFDNGSGVSGSGSAEASVGAEAHASAEGTIDADGNMTGTAEVGASVEASASAEGEIEMGVVSVGGSAEAAVGASATATATGTIGPDGVSASVGVAAMAGASASATANVEAMGVEGSVTATAYAGAGVKAEVGVEASFDEVSVTVDLGVALGVGAGVSFDLSFSPKEAAEDILSIFGW